MEIGIKMRKTFGRGNWNPNNDGAVKRLTYHKDWRRLMPVVEKIADLPDMNFNLSSFDGCCFYDDDYKHTASGKRIVRKENGMLQSTWLAIVEFIKWHNTQKQTVK